MATLRDQQAPLPAGVRSGDIRTQSSKRRVVTILLVILCASAVFARLMYVKPPFSYDYIGYKVIIGNLSRLSFSEMIGNNFVFPYVMARGIVPIEIGFSVLVKALMGLTGKTETVFALIAAASVGLRVYTMMALRVPLLIILLVNIYAITLFEANAIRLGVAASILLFGLHKLLQSRRVIGYTSLFVAIFFHLQLVIFVLPFVASFVFSKWVVQSKMRIAFFVLSSIAASFVFIQLVPAISNVKLVRYLAIAEPVGSGLTLTSFLSVAFLASCAVVIGRQTQPNQSTKFWTSIVLASVPSSVMLMFFTDVPIIGDRAWQLAFVVLATFFFSGWATVRQKRTPYLILLILIITSVLNVAIRYPLSDFFSPPLPPIEVVRVYG